jgi:hypothetical protein
LNTMLRTVFVTYVTLCTDVLNPLDDDMGVFAHTKTHCRQTYAGGEAARGSDCQTWMLSGVNKYTTSRRAQPLREPRDCRA